MIYLLICLTLFQSSTDIEGDKITTFHTMGKCQQTAAKMNKSFGSKELTKAFKADHYRNIFVCVAEPKK